MTPTSGREPGELFAEALGGQRRSLARLLSLVERGGDPARELGRLVAARAGSAYTVGITGAPGAGKSTLTGALVGELRRSGDEVAVLAIDPSSPFSGGAILGDRIRMEDHALDPGVFIRSMATRGHLGGLSLAAPEAVRLLDALGWRWVLVETVGVGQVELEIAGQADSTVVVVTPGWGDAVQANKAGLLEIADVFVVNKSDRAGAAETRRDLETALDLAERAPGDWRPPVLSTVATTGAGAADLWAAVLDHRGAITASGELARRRRARLEHELREVLIRRLEARARRLATGERWEELTEAVASGTLDPWSAADLLLGESDR